MSVLDPLRSLPEPLKMVFRRTARFFIPKATAELSFWKNRYHIENGQFDNSHYQSLMLEMAGESGVQFLDSRIVADFECGPRGSLEWATSAAIRIGIDILADQYVDEFTGNLLNHNMLYLKSTERVIPLPNHFIDVMFSLNALDHVMDFPTICREIIRVIKPGGEFIGSINLGEPKTVTEPQKLTKEKVDEHLLQRLDIRSYRICNQVEGVGLYDPFFGNTLSYDEGKPGILWVRASKPT